MSAVRNSSWAAQEIHVSIRVIKQTKLPAISEKKGWGGEGEKEREKRNREEKSREEIEEGKDGGTSRNKRIITLFLNIYINMCVNGEN